MSASVRRSGLPFLLCCLLATACGTSRSAEAPRTAATAHPSAGAAPIRTSGLYGADEALRDALSGPWEYVGTGKWPGINRSEACAFRNQRVLIVNVYCTISDAPAFRIDVYSPSRGRVRIYAESSGPISGLTRRDYFTFTAESEPAPGPGTHLPPVMLTMSFDELRAYDEQRYDAFLPSCYGGTELSKSRVGCLGTLAPSTPEWMRQHRAFLDHANDDWYRMVREMRAMATRYGKDPT